MRKFMAQLRKQSIAGDAIFFTLSIDYMSRKSHLNANLHITRFSNSN